MLRNSAFQSTRQSEKVRVGAGTASLFCGYGLPGRDGDDADLRTLTPNQFRETVLKAIAGETAPVVLVGHRFGAEERPPSSGYLTELEKGVDRVTSGV